MHIIGQLAHEFWQDHNPRVPYEAEYFLDFVRDNIGKPDFLALLLGDDQGMLLAILTKSIFSPRKLAKEIVWFTRPSARGHGMQLFRIMNIWAEMMGVEDIHCSLQKPSPVMERLGFTTTEFGYIRPVNYSRTSQSVGAAPEMV
jgi:hypothetical protein